MLMGDVLREILFSRSTVSFAAASADEARSVADDPLLSFRIKVTARAFGSTRHFSTIPRISAAVV
jgi:hypothetical protein